jgi:hypothetical protein
MSAKTSVEKAMKERSSAKGGGEQLQFQWDRESQGLLVDEALGKMETQIKHGEMKGSIMDLVRLIQLHREMEYQQPTEVQVTWVETLKEEDAVKI